MAIVILGKSTCPICGEILDSRAEPIVGFTAFSGNEADPLHFFNDAAFHKSCFQQHPLAADATRASGFSDESRKSWPYPCSVCGHPIDNVDELEGTSYVTLNEQSPLYALNKSFFHRACLPLHPKADALLTEIRRVKRNGEWVGRGLDSYEEAFSKRKRPL